MSTRAWMVGLLILGGAAGVPGAEAGKRRPLAVEDFAALQEIANPRISPEGEWAAFEVKTQDLEEDEAETRLWMVATAGGDPIPLTRKGSSAGSARWSPDGRQLAFLSDRPGPDTKAGRKKDKEKSQVWVLDRRGGEARRLTDVEQGIEAFEWAPDSHRLVLVIRDRKPEWNQADTKESKTEEDVPAPWVIDRLQFKQDYRGYLDRRRTHLFVFDIAKGESRQVTFGDYDDSEPAWAPDGQSIAFVSNRTEEPDSNYNSDLWLVRPGDPAEEPKPTQLTLNPGSDTSPVWNPSGTLLAYETTTRPEIVDYAQTHLAVIPAAGGRARVLTADLDRNATAPRFSPDGKELLFLLEDHGEVQLARVPVTGGDVTRLLTGPRVVKAAEVDSTGTAVTLISDPHRPGELFASDPEDLATLRPLTRLNEELLSGIDLAEVEKVAFRSPDGTPVEAFVYRPPAFEPGRRYPTILWLHGGPQAQHDHAFSFRGQLFASNGYLVVMPNPRGSTGYGQDFTLGIWADWGDHDTQDVLAAVDHVIEQGLADPHRLGVGGWSYGGILTNYVITSTDRFAGAVSGASGALWVANYGHDHYQRWYEGEFGLPWETRELWERLSPYNKVEKITTPTLWIGGEKDWNVPILNSEQMYQAMKRLGRETRLVVYPGEHHGIKRPSYQKHMYEQFVAWIDEHVKGAGPTRQGIRPKPVRSAE
jgi:dipeptidyl aminopeptidase/acylaminoacyl peptidase